jgi:DNA-directed RNA polymerase specialized sigma24 family protein
MRILRPPPRRQGTTTRHLEEFGMLYSDCFRGVYGYIAARVQDPPTAEDLTSETFLRAWRRWLHIQGRLACLPETNRHRGPAR